jgi:5-methylcytosine-specific restriction endonuclease McrA
MELRISEGAEKLEKQRDYARRWRERNREKLLEYYRIYREKHKEHLTKFHSTYYRQHVEDWKKRAQDPEAKKKRKTYNAAHAEQRNLMHRAWRERNLNHALEAERRRRLKTRDKRRERDRVWRQRNPETYKSSIAVAKAANPDLYRMLQRKSSAVRRSRRRGSPVEPVSLKRIFDRDGMRCHLCTDFIDLSEASVDHLIPVVRGGAFAEWNLMVAHLVCNRRRGTKPILTQETREFAESYLASRLIQYAKENCV